MPCPCRRRCRRHRRRSLARTLLLRRLIVLIGLPVAASVVLSSFGLRTVAARVVVPNSRLCNGGFFARCAAPCCCADDDGEKDRETGASLSDLLDRPVIDPESPRRDDEPALLTAFKKLVDEDYQMAEAIYAGGVFAILIFFSQQAVRVYKHCYFQPDKLCPWDTAAGVDQFWF